MRRVVAHSPVVGANNSFGLLNQKQRGCRLHSEEEVRIALRDWLRKFKPVPSLDECISMIGVYPE